LAQKQPKYLKIAHEAILEVFQKDYILLALPRPKVKFMTKDEENYQSGEYSIDVRNNWQIHLNFGQLPAKVKEFREEVKALTRHEVEHYQTCPFDVLSQARMLKTILATNKDHAGTIPENAIKRFVGTIANEIADVIVDTKIYFKYPKETLISEINWIKKGGEDSFKNLPRHSKLLFLLKAALWKEDLHLEETDVALLSKVNQLATEFESHRVTKLNTFLYEAKKYTELYIELFELDMVDYENKTVHAGSTEPRDSNESGERPNSEGDDEQQVTNSPLPPKDGSAMGGQLVFSDPDKVESAISQIAQETSLDEFELLLDIFGVVLKDENGKKKIWFEQNNVDEIPIDFENSKSSENEISYPSTWKIGEPFEDLDILLSLQTSPRLLPGITTKKWELQYRPESVGDKNNSDMLLVIDTSGSMGNDTTSGSRLHEAYLACFGFIKFFEEKKGKIALVNFSSQSIVCEWTNDYNKIKDTLLINQGQSTNFPTDTIERLTNRKKEDSVVVIITDGAIQNWEKTLSLLTELCYLNNDVFLFLMGDEIAVDTYSELRNVGGFVEHAFTVNDIREAVFNHIR
jgi:hypothetical protein